MLRKIAIVAFFIIFTPALAFASKPNIYGELERWGLCTLIDKPALSLQMESSPAGGEKSFLQNVLAGTFVGRIVTGEPFERTGLVDILAALLLAFVAAGMLHHFKNKPSSKNESFPEHREAEEDNSPCPPPPDVDLWARLRSKPLSKNDEPARSGWENGSPQAQDDSQTQGDPHAQPSAGPSNSPVEAGKASSPLYGEADEFLKGAKLLYARLYEAEREGDLDFIKHFSSGSGFEEYWKKRTPADYLSIVTVRASIVFKNNDQGQEKARVEFSSLVHRSEQVGPPVNMEESWLFVLDKTRGSWIFEKHASGHGQEDA